jgi:integrase
MNLQDALERFARSEGETLAPNTLSNYRSAVRSLIAFGVTTTRQLTRANVAAWIAKRRREDVAPVTINTQLAGVLSVASALERESLFPLKRLRGLRRLRIRGVASDTPDPSFLTRDEVARLRVEALALDPQLDLAVAFAVFGGLRLNELRRLHGEDLVIDPNESKPYIRVLRARGETKTRRSRSAPIARAFADDLLRRELPAGPIFPPRNRNGRGLYMSRETLKTWLRETRDRSELYHCTWFVLRHCFASYLRQNGVELSLVSGFMGNSVRVCEKHYASIGPGGNAQVERGFAERPSDTRATGS